MGALQLEYIMLFNFSKLRTAMKFSEPRASNLSHKQNLNTHPNQTPNTEINFDKIKQGLFYAYGALSLSFIGAGIYLSIFKENELIKKFGEQAIRDAKISSRVIP